MKARAKFRIGDEVEPKPEWKDDSNNIPSGRVRAIDRDRPDCLYVGDDQRAFADYVFDLAALAAADFDLECAKVITGELD